MGGVVSMTINRRWIAREWLYLPAGFVWAYVLFPILIPPLARLALWIFPRPYGPAFGTWPGHYVRSLCAVPSRVHNDVGDSDLAGETIEKARRMTGVISRRPSAAILKDGRFQAPVPTSCCTARLSDNRLMFAYQKVARQLLLGLAEDFQHCLAVSTRQMRIL